MVFDGFSLLITVIVIIHSVIALMHCSVIKHLLVDARGVARTHRIVNPLRTGRLDHYRRLLTAGSYLVWSIMAAALAVPGTILRHVSPLSSYIYVGAFLAIAIGMAMYARSLIKAADSRLERRKIILGLSGRLKNPDNSLVVTDSADFH